VFAGLTAQQSSSRSFSTKPHDKVKHIGSLSDYSAPSLPAPQGHITGRKYRETQDQRRPPGWGTQVRIGIPPYPSSWFCPLSQLVRTKRCARSSRFLAIIQTRQLQSTSL